MADDLGAVRRTPRPTGDHQTPETGPSVDASATITPSPVSGDHPGVREDVSGDLSPEVAAALVEDHGPEIQAIADAFHELRGKLHATAVLGHLHTTDNDMQAFLELPDCTACGGTGKDTNGSPFETPYAVHFAGPPVKAEGRQRQLCMWCGHVLSDLPSRKGETAPSWPAGALVRIEDGLDSVVPHEPGAELPPGCCALPDDEPRGYGERVCRRCDVQAAFCPCIKPDVACGKHVPGTGSNRCLLRAGHTGDCSDEFEPAETPGCCTACNGTGTVEGGYPCEDCYATGHCHPGDVSCDGVQAAADGPDEAQETRAADWPAEEVPSG